MTVGITEGVVQVGDVAPDFTLRNHRGEEVTLSGLRGQNVVLVFYPFAFSGTCTGELCAIRDSIEEFETAGVKVLAISCDPMHSLAAFAKEEGYTFDLLSDFWPHGAVAQKYGVFADAAGMAVRGSFLIDADGVVRWEVVNSPGEARPLQSYLDALAGL